jgi:heterotetrameric sarcosine oxidase beta subunit
MRYSAFALARQALSRHRGWPVAWRKAEPRSNYAIVIVGGGGHGLATAYYLARNHGITDVAVLERSHVGSGNVGRNTTIVRSNYLLQQSIPFYEHSLKLWEGLSSDLNFNVMFSQRAVVDIFHSDGERDAAVRRANALRLNGVDAEILSSEEVKREIPTLEVNSRRFPVYGAHVQRRGGTARHDAVAWGYARAADRLGVDIIEGCAVTNLLRDGRGRIRGVETTRGQIGADRVAIAVAGDSSRVAAMAGLRLPIETHLLQAFVTEGVKPLINTVITFGAGHTYISQSDKGGLVFGGSLDGYNSYAQRGNFPTVRNVAEGILQFLPSLSRLRLLRHWAGKMDMSMDGQPLVDRTAVEGLYINTGWCYGGFKATPASGWCFAHLLATGESHILTARHRLDRFRTGYLIDEKAQGPFPNRH